MDISNDLRALLALKHERKSSLMMAVIFSYFFDIATPFSIGMVSVYGSFMGGFGKTSQIIQLAPIIG